MLNHMKAIKQKTKRMLEIESSHNKPIESILHNLWIIEEKSVNEVMKELNIGYAAVYSWLKQSGIYSRKLDIYKSQDRIFY